ncbi:MAG TPA: TIGR01620 family protein [Xanthobacteraceae bacterium]|nr:TIGR01620 family protein [Xanthobacteraceae bacterium]
MTVREPRQDTRRPETFKLDDPRVVVTDPGEETARLSLGTIRITPEADFSALPQVVEQPYVPPRRGFRWSALFWGALGCLVLLGAGLGVANLVEDLYARSQGLGWFGAGVAALMVIALVAIIAREALGLSRLAAIEAMHRDAAEAIATDDRAKATPVIAELLKISRENPRLAYARARLGSHLTDIIDGADMIRLAERELMTPLDQEARRLVSAAAQRVSLVTAISPRALIDILFVLAAALRLVRQLSRLYGGRPGALGMITLMRHTISHLAITGGMAASESVIQQMLGHGVAAKLSTRLGEGILNGLLTARLGLAAIDVTRPLPFVALPRPSLGDLAKDLVRRQEQES